MMARALGELASVCIRVSGYVCVCVHVYLCVCVCECVCVHVCMYLCACSGDDPPVRRSPFEWSTITLMKLSGLAAS